RPAARKDAISHLFSSRFAAPNQAGDGRDSPIHQANKSLFAGLSTHRHAGEEVQDMQCVGWVEQSEAHRAERLWASHGSTHPTSSLAAEAGSDVRRPATAKKSRARKGQASAAGRTGASAEPGSPSENPPTLAASVAWATLPASHSASAAQSDSARPDIILF